MGEDREKLSGQEMGKGGSSLGEEQEGGTDSYRVQDRKHVKRGSCTGVLWSSRGFTCSSVRLGRQRGGWSHWGLVYNRPGRDEVPRREIDLLQRRVGRTWGRWTSTRDSRTGAVLVGYTGNDQVRIKRHTGFKLGHRLYLVTRTPALWSSGLHLYRPFRFLAQCRCPKPKDVSSRTGPSQGHGHSTTTGTSHKDPRTDDRVPNRTFLDLSRCGSQDQ